MAILVVHVHIIGPPRSNKGERIVIFDENWAELKSLDFVGLEGGTVDSPLVIIVEVKWKNFLWEDVENEAFITKLV